MTRDAVFLLLVSLITILSRHGASALSAPSPETARSAFLASLSTLATINDSSSSRTSLLDELIAKKKEVDVEDYPLGHIDDQVAPLSISKPGLWRSMQPVAEGTWKVIYAPHLAFGRDVLGGGDLDVSYLLKADGTLSSHAKWSNFPWIPSETKSIYLSVSGTYGSVSDNVCEVLWDKAWVRSVDKEGLTKDVPFDSLDDVPDSIPKNLINAMGKLFFIRPVSVFPVSFLSEDLVVFDFELLRTRICARKLAAQPQQIELESNKIASL